MLQLELDGADLLRGPASPERELKIIAVAAPPQVLQVVAIVRDEPAHHAHVAHSVLEFSFRGFQVAARVGQVFLRRADFSCHRSDLLLALLFHLAQLAGQPLIGSLLLLADGFGAAVGLRHLGAGHAQLLLRHFQMPLQVGQARVGLLQLRGYEPVLVRRLRERLLQTGVRRVADVSQRPGREKQNHE